MKLELRKNFRIKLFASIFIVLCCIWLFFAAITPVKVRAEGTTPNFPGYVTFDFENTLINEYDYDWADVYAYIISFWEYGETIILSANIYDVNDNLLTEVNLYLHDDYDLYTYTLIVCDVLDDWLIFTIDDDKFFDIKQTNGQIKKIELILERTLPSANQFPGYVEFNLNDQTINHFGYVWSDVYATIKTLVDGEDVYSYYPDYVKVYGNWNYYFENTPVQTEYKIQVTADAGDTVVDEFIIYENNSTAIGYASTDAYDYIYRLYWDFPTPPPLENYPKELVTGWIPNHNDQFKIVVPNLDTMNITEVGGQQRSLALENGYIYQVELITDSPATAFAKIMNNNTSTELALFHRDSFVVSKPAPEYSVEAFIISGDQDIVFDINEYGSFVFHNCTGIKFYKILVDENSRPFISGEEVFVTNVDDAKPLSYFLNLFTAIDLEDGDVTESITVVLDNYSDNKGVLNTPHKVTIQASDSSNNTTTADFYITVVDVTPPVISGNTNLVQVSYTQTWSVSNFKASLTVQDNYDVLSADDIVIKSNTYQGNETVLGTYTVTFEITDSSGNKGTFLKNVKVIDDILPEFTGPETITSRINTMLTVSYVKAQLTASDEKSGNLTNRITLVEDNYSGKGHKKGTYTVKFSVEDNAGNTAYHTVTIVRVDSIPPKIYVVDGLNIRTSPEIPLTFNQIVDILIATGQQTLNAETQFFLLDEDYFGNEEEVGLYTMTLRALSTDGTESTHEVTINVLEAEEDGITVSPAQTIIDWIKNNVVLFVIIVAAVLTVVYLAFKKKR